MLTKFNIKPKKAFKEQYIYKNTTKSNLTTVDSFFSKTSLVMPFKNKLFKFNLKQN